MASRYNLRGITAAPLDSGIFEQNGDQNLALRRPEPVLIHPLFQQNRFAHHIHYETGFRRAAILASRLLRSPQAMHFFYGVYFGTNTIVRPVTLCVELDRLSNNKVPQQFASDKGVDDLTSRDREAIDERLRRLASRITYETLLFGSTQQGGCAKQPEREGVRGCDSVIYVNYNMYAMIQYHGLDRTERACREFEMAMTLLHEVAHASCFDVMGPRCEDYFEDSPIAEAGYELEARIFGVISELGGRENPLESKWVCWPHKHWHNGSYNLNEICRDWDQLVSRNTVRDMEDGFFLKLASDSFWNGEYLQHGALALLPPFMTKICRRGGRTIDYTSIPRSIRDLFRDGGKSYAQKRYAHLTNPEYRLREALPFS